MDKDILPLQYIAALEDKLTEQVRINEDMFKTVLELESEISRLENLLRKEKCEIVLNEFLRTIDSHAEA